MINVCEKNVKKQEATVESETKTCLPSALTVIISLRTCNQHDEEVLKDTVKPVDGYYHRLTRQASRNNLHQKMRYGFLIVCSGTSDISQDMMEAIPVVLAVGKNV